MLQFVGVCHLMEERRGCDVRVLSTWGKRLEAFGLWYDQLLAESLGKQERGALPLTVVNTRDLHSRGQQHQEGKRDKLITNLIVDQPRSEPVAIGRSELDQDGLNELADKTLPQISWRGDRRHESGLSRRQSPDGRHSPAAARRVHARPVVPNADAGHGGRRPADRHQPVRPAGRRGVQAEYECDLARKTVVESCRGAVE